MYDHNENRAKLPPQDIDAEEAVLGALVIDGSAISQVSDRLAPAHFAQDRNAWCYQACLSLADRSEAIDSVTLARELEAKGRLDGVGGRAYLAHLAAVTPTSVHARHYAGIVRAAADKRALIGVAGTVADQGYGPATPEEAIRVSLDALLALRAFEERQTFFRPRDLAALAAEQFARLSLATNPDMLPTGFRDLDALIGGMSRGDVTVLAARPSMGKSQLAWQIARNSADNGRRVLVASSEMTARDLLMRELARRARVSVQYILRGGYGDGLAAHIDALVSWLERVGLHILAGMSITTQAVSGKLRESAAEQPIDLVVVDYLQLLADQYGDGGTARVTEISRRLKCIAMDHNVAVLAVSQCNRSPTHTTDKRPTIADLRESGAIEQDASNVLLLHRPDYYKPTDRPGVAEVGVGKCRQGGKTGICELVWVARESRYADKARTEEENR